MSRHRQSTELPLHPGPAAPSARRLRVVIRGVVQGVGFRPFVYRLATELGLVGWVSNSAQGVNIEAEGARDRLEEFLFRLEPEQPPHAAIHSLEPSYLDATGFDSFEIRQSAGGEKTALIMPDIATCSDCLAEVLDPSNRRYHYPFANCTNCGPRYSIIEALPYDRPNTSMSGFQMCPRCQAEYDGPANRRFHAQPNACPDCGPQLALWNPAGTVLATHHEALEQTVTALRRGRIVAVKGLGGFHLMADAGNPDAVTELRRRKHREEKPLALMFPSLAAVERVCIVSPGEARLLQAPESPIVLLARKANEPEGAAIAPGNPSLGAMLPYTPLHHLLLRQFDSPLVATSGNLSEEPICTDEGEALQRLAGIADLFLVHDRPIVRHVDDSIVRLVVGREMVLRRARGYAPLPIELAPATVGRSCVLAVGGHLKNTIAQSVGRHVFISQHIGDLESAAAFDAFRAVIPSFETLYQKPPQTIACDLHPDYASTRAAEEMGQPLVRVQHHYAHVLSCMADNRLEAPVLGVAWDGAGYGTDGSIWGGEFLLVGEKSFSRAASFRTFPLPGGEAAIREPRRSALGALFELYGDAVFDDAGLAPLAAFTAAELPVLRGMLRQELNCPRTSSVGRLFDAVASLAGLRQRCRFEGQAAMELEFALAHHETEAYYDYGILEAQPGVGMDLCIDWQPMLEGVVEDCRSKSSPGMVSAKFHNALARVIVDVAQRLGEPRIILSGGCFQNKYLTETAVHRLRQAGFSAYWHQRVPPNDGGIALGQVLAAWRQAQ